MNDYESNLRLNDEIGSSVGQPIHDYVQSNSSYGSAYCNSIILDAQNGWDRYHSLEIESSGIELFTTHEDEQSSNVDVTIKGKRREDDGIFLRLRIADKEGPKHKSFSYELYCGISRMAR